MAAKRKAGEKPEPVDFYPKVLDAEHAAIKQRREKWLADLDRLDYGIENDVRRAKDRPIKQKPKRKAKVAQPAAASAARPAQPEKPPGTTPDAPLYVCDTVGLALSGGGMRSAAFCLGAIQALEALGAFKRIDYLSTVSGGGYIGTSLTALLNAKGETDPFPYKSLLRGEETPSLQHVRDYSNFLMPHGGWDIWLSVSIYLRGLAANVLLVLPCLLFAAWATILWKPSIEALKTSRFVGCDLSALTDSSFFNLTRFAALFLFLVLAGWALLRSHEAWLNQPDVPSLRSTLVASGLLALVLIAGIEFQAFVLNEMFAYAARESGDSSGWIDWLVAAGKYVAVVLAPAAAVVGFVSNKLSFVIKRATENSDFQTRLLALLSRALIYVTACVVPLLLWMVYLTLTYWGIANGQKYAAPDWIVSLSETSIFAWLGLWPISWFEAPIAWVYISIGTVIFVISYFLEPNSNSLHRLYRDRLAKAFLFFPLIKLEYPSQDIEPLPSMKLSSLRDDAGPYQLINTALNIQGSKSANRRGRDADFFVFSRHYVGSKATQYARTEALEENERYLDLATVMAVSGAAASSNMGASELKPWALSLAMLNIRLGFWMRNPKYAYGASKTATLLDWMDSYFFWEMASLLDERSWTVYLTDGGHVENLGVYELLRRRCQLVIAVDAEADPDLNFPSLMMLQRYARIDLGIRIELPWYDIRTVSLDTNTKLKKRGDAGEMVDRQGPHCAIGLIHYPEGTGYLLYVKSSMTGDENDYVMDYKRRNAAFPHETTGDLFYSEEQFEAYRSLGFHAMQGALNDRDHVPETEQEPSPDEKSRRGAAARSAARASRDPDHPLREHICRILQAKDPAGTLFGVKRSASRDVEEVDPKDVAEGRPGQDKPP